MIYNGKLASQEMQKGFKERIAGLGRAPVLGIISVAEHPSIQSFIKIKRTYAEAVGVTIKEFNFEEESNEQSLVAELQKLVASGEYDGIIVQLPLPTSYDVQRVLDTIPKEFDVDVLSTEANALFMQTGNPMPTVVGAIAHILSNSHIDLIDKKVVIVGQGKLVGMPVAVWLKHKHVEPATIDNLTDQSSRAELLAHADIVISGSGVPHLIKPQDLKSGVILIDAGTSEQAGVLAGDCDPACADIASVFTPVPGGVGPLTVAHLFDNLIMAAEKRK